MLDDLVLDGGLAEVPGWLANAVKIVDVDPIVLRVVAVLERMY